MKNWISKYLSDEQIKNISQAVLEAEKHTTGEIVPVIVKKSSATEHVKWILAALITLVFVIAENFYIQNHWNPNNLWAPPVAFILFYAVSIYLGQIPWFQRVLTPNIDEVIQVHNRAELEFHRAQITKTQGGTGILLFVSVMERRAVVLADQGIAAHYPPETWDEVMALMTSEFRQGQVAAGFEKAIKRCGEILQAKLPAVHHDTNELANQLIIKE